MAENVVTKKRSRLGGDAVNALVSLNGSHGVAWDSGISQEELRRKDNCLISSIAGALHLVALLVILAGATATTTAVAVAVVSEHDIRSSEKNQSSRLAE